MTEGKPCSNTFSEGTETFPYPLADRLQGLETGPTLGCMDPHAFQRAVVHSEKDGCLPFRCRDGARHVGPPHLIDPLSSDLPVMGLGAMGVTPAMGGKELILSHEAKDTQLGSPHPLKLKPRTYFAIAFPMERRIGKDSSYVLQEFPVRTGTDGTRPSLHLRFLMKSPVKGGFRHLPHPKDHHQTIRPSREGRGCPIHLLDLFRPIVSPTSIRIIFSWRSSPSIVITSPDLSHRRVTSRSLSTNGLFYMASDPAPRNFACFSVRLAAGTPSSGLTSSIPSPRNRRMSTPALRLAENVKSQRSITSESNPGISIAPVKQAAKLLHPFLITTLNKTLYQLNRRKSCPPVEMNMVSKRFF